MVRKAKASAGIAPFGEKKQETLIELQDSRTYTNDHQKLQQEQLQEQMNLRMLEEQEASIRQLEVNIFLQSPQKYTCKLLFILIYNNYVIYLFHRVILAILIKYLKILEL